VDLVRLGEAVGRPEISQRIGWRRLGAAGENPYQPHAGPAATSVMAIVRSRG
jgi:hypothetical protein